MVYKTAGQKILIWLFILTLAITLISGTDYWQMWSILPITFFMLWLASKRIFPLLIMNLDVMFLDEKAYQYEPNYDNWRETNAADY
jgi:cytochrome b subunit of formate dehydrogenase